MIWPLAALVLSLVACGGGSGTAPSVRPTPAPSVRPTPNQTPTPAPTPTPTASPPGSLKVTHVVIVIQENRTFNNLFMDFPGALSASTGNRCDASPVSLHAVPLEANYDLGHGLIDYNAEWNGGQGNCFDRGSYIGPTPAPSAFAYAYVPQSETAPYWALARKYVLADHFFPSNLDSSFAAHQYLIAGQAQNSVDVPTEPPWGCDGPPGEVEPTITQQRTFGSPQTPCFTYPTLATELDRAGLSWRFYGPPVQGNAIWSAFDAISQVRYGPDWANVISPETRILTDVQAGTLANVTWVVPDAMNSDHPGWRGNGGPQWVTSVVDAVGTSKYWDSTAIFVLWDDWGGWYDPVVPAYADYDGLGFRVPLITISPYARTSQVAHTQYEFGSILKFVEDRWRLARLAPSDTRAAPFGSDIFDFTQTPLPYTPFGPSGEFQRFTRERPSYRAPDND